MDLVEQSYQTLSTKPELNLGPYHPAQSQVAQEAKRFNVLVCGRRWGKTTMSVKQHAENAFKGQRSAYFAPSYKLMTETWREMLAALGQHVTRSNASDRRIEVGEGVIEFWSLDTPDAARGRKYHFVDIDEAAMVPHLEQAWNAAIRPTLTDYKGTAWFRSTPRGLNYFHALFQRGQDPNFPDWVSWQMPTVSNPFIDPLEVESAKGDMAEMVFSQEYLAQFISDGNGVFRNVQKLSTLEPIPPEPTTYPRNARYVLGVDWGKVNDFTVISVWDTQTRQEVYLDRFNQIDYAVQSQRLKALDDKYKPIEIWAEANSIGVPIIEGLTRMGLPVRPFQTTNASKNQVIEALALSMEREQVQLQNHTVATGEMLAFQVERVNGLTRYGAPAGQHDDTVMARCIGHFAAARPTVPTQRTTSSIRYGG